MRIASPCTEDLDRMARTRDGSFCAKCAKNVVDLRRVPKKRALAVIAELRAAGDGQVCVRARATRDGIPVFANEPSRLSRFALPMALAGSLAACATPSTTPRDTTPVALVRDADGQANGNGTPGASLTRVTTVAPEDLTNTANVSVPTDTVDMAGGLAFTGP